MLVIPTVAMTKPQLARVLVMLDTAVLMVVCHALLVPRVLSESQEHTSRVRAMLRVRLVFRVIPRKGAPPSPLRHAMCVGLDTTRQMDSAVEQEMRVVHSAMPTERDVAEALPVAIMMPELVMLDTAVVMVV